MLPATISEPLISILAGRIPDCLSSALREQPMQSICVHGHFTSLRARTVLKQLSIRNLLTHITIGTNA